MINSGPRESIDSTGGLSSDKEGAVDSFGGERIPGRHVQDASNASVIRDDSLTVASAPMGPNVAKYGQLSNKLRLIIHKNR